MQIRNLEKMVKIKDDFTYFRQTLHSDPNVMITDSQKNPDNGHRLSWPRGNW